MFVASNFLLALAKVLEILLTVYYWLILIRALVSWVNPDPDNPIVQFLQQTTDPALYPLRKLLPFTYRLGIDFSPFLAVLIIIFLKSFLVRTLVDIAARLSGT